MLDANESQIKITFRLPKGGVFRTWGIARLAVFLLTIASTFLIGFFLVGPFVDSPQYDFILRQVSDNPFLGALLDPTPFLVNQLIAAAVPGLLWLSAKLWLYSADESNGPAVNKIAEFLDPLASGVGSLILIYSSVLFGFTTYVGSEAGFSEPIVQQAYLMGIGFVLVGLGTKKASAGPIALSSRRHSISHYGKWVLLGLGLLALAWTVFGDLLMSAWDIWQVLKQQV